MLNREQVRYYLRKAYRLAQHNSHDPRTQNGAVIVDPDNDKVIGMGVNCFPYGVSTLPERMERPLKYSWMEHAERNAIYWAARNGSSTYGAIMYCPWFSCADCARSIIQAGISKVIGHKQVFEKYGSGPWDDSINIGNQMFKEAGVDTELYDGEIGNDPNYGVDIEIMLNGVKWRP